MNEFHKMLIMLAALAVIGIGISIVANSGILDTGSVKNVVINHQNETESLLSKKTGEVRYINETTAEVIFDNESTGTVTFGTTVSEDDLKLPREKEQQAIDVALNDPDVKKILDGKKYSVTKVQKVAITTVDRTYLSEDIVVVEIEVGNLLYFVNVDMLKKSVQGNVVPIQKVEMVKNVS